MSATVLPYSDIAMLPAAKASHLSALILCLGAAVLVATLPHWLFLDLWQRPIWIADHDEMFYLAIAGQAYDNHPWRLSEPMLAGGLQNPYPWLQLSPGILLAKAAGLGPLAVGLLWRGSGALLIAFCYYLLTYRITRVKAVAACLTVWICADVGVLYSMPVVRQLRLLMMFLTGSGEHLLQSYPQIAPSWRIVTPTLSLGYLLLLIFLLGRALDRPTWRRLAAAGVACGVLFYAYFYFMVAAGLALGVNALIDAKRRWTYVYVGAIGLLCGMPQIIGQLALKGTTSSDWLQRWDMFVKIPRTSELLVPKMAIVVSVLCLIWCLRRARHLLYLWVFAAAALLLLNQQLLTSLQIQNYHWIYVVGPVHAVLLVALVWHELERAPLWRRRLCRVLYLATPLLFISSLWLRSIEATRTKESQAIMRDLVRYTQLRLDPKRSPPPLLPNALVAGAKDFIDWASVLENQRPLVHYTVISSPSIDDREWDERVALNSFLQAIGRDDFIATQGRDLAISSPRSASVRASRLAGRLAAYDQINADPKPALGRLPVRYVAVTPQSLPPEHIARLGMAPLQSGPHWELWRLP